MSWPDRVRRASRDQEDDGHGRGFRRRGGVVHAFRLGVQLRRDRAGLSRCCCQLRGRWGAAGRTTGDADEPVALLDSVLARAEQNEWSWWSVVRAARTTALLGPAGRSLTARLEAVLDDPVRAPAAVAALAAVAEPAALDRIALAAAALRSAESDADPAGACGALEALGAAAMTGDPMRRLAALADGDARVVRFGVEDRIIHQDEAVRKHARALLPAFTDFPVA